jgi:hypothetical protein
VTSPADSVLFTRLNGLVDEFLELSFYNGKEKHEAYKRLVAQAQSEFGANGKRYIAGLLAVSQARLVIVEGDCTMNDNRVSQSGTGNQMNAVNAGGSQWTGNITAINQTIQNSGTMDGNVKAALQDLVKYVETAKLDDDEKEDITTMASRIAQQFNGTAKPDEGKIKKWLDNIKSVAGTATAVVGLGTALAKLFGWGAAAAGS